MAEAKVPAHIEPYVEVLGVELALELFLVCGGSQIYLSRKSSDRTTAAQTIGASQVERLAERMGHGYIKVPLAREWIARTMRAQGKSDNEIARRVRADVASVRRWLGPKSAAIQLNLPL